MRAANGREAALEAMRRMRRAGEYSSDAVDGVIKQSALEPREAAFCTRIVRETLQNLYFIDHYLNLWSNTPTKRLEPAVLDILRISAAQLLFMDRVPPSAAVNEGVNLCAKSGCKRAGGLVNSVLRRVSEHRDALPEIPGEGTAEYLATRYSHELWQVRELIERRGYEGARAVLERNNAEPPLTLQTNTLRTTAQELAEKLRAAGLEPEAGASPGELRLRGAGRADLMPGYAEGLFYVQDGAARQAVTAAGAQPGMTVLDACAAPGGKAALMCEMMRGTGRVHAWDLHEHRVQLIKAAGKRLRLDNLRPAERDASVRREDLECQMDAVLVDAPCSGLGVMTDKPDLKYRVTDESIESLKAEQKKILDACSSYVKVGGLLVYSTCSILPEENEKQVEEFLLNHPEFKPDEGDAWVPEKLKPRFRNGMLALLPCRDGVEGFFIARMRRVSL